ncbi:MAG: CcmD family protein [Gaiellaceae bacterium]
MSSQGQYLAAAYLVVFAVVLAYVLIIATKLVRLQREVSELVRLAAARDAGAEPDAEPELEQVTVG